MRLNIVFLAACLLIFSGCSIPPFKPTGEYKNFRVQIIIDDNIIQDGVKVQGLARCGNAGRERFCILTVPSIDALDDFDWYYWGKELGHAYYDDYHKGIEDIY